MLPLEIDWIAITSSNQAYLYSRRYYHKCKYGNNRGFWNLCEHPPNMCFLKSTTREDSNRPRIVHHLYDCHNFYWVARIVYVVLLFSVNALVWRVSCLNDTRELVESSIVPESPYLIYFYVNSLVDPTTSWLFWVPFAQFPLAFWIQSNIWELHPCRHRDCIPQIGK